MEKERKNEGKRDTENGQEGKRKTEKGEEEEGTLYWWGKRVKRREDNMEEKRREKMGEAYKERKTEKRMNTVLVELESAGEDSNEAEGGKRMKG